MSRRTFAVRCSAFVTSHDVPKLNRPLQSIEEKKINKLATCTSLTETLSSLIQCPSQSHFLSSSLRSVSHLPGTWLLASPAPTAAQPARAPAFLLLSHFTTRHMSSHAFTAPPPPSRLPAQPSRGRPRLPPAGCYCLRWQVAEASRLRLRRPIASRHCSAGSQSCRRCACRVRYV